MSKATTINRNSHNLKAMNGFTLIELMIVIATIAIILTLALPVYSTYTIRAKLGESLSVAAAAKIAVSATCLENPLIPALTEALAEYQFDGSLLADSYVNTVSISGPCSAPVISTLTKNTGATPDPTVFLTGSFILGSGRIEWTCTSDTPNQNLPITCRS